MAMYLMGYAALRFFVESLRIDPAHEIAGLRVNTWMSIIVFIAAAAWLAWESKHHAEPVPAFAGGPEGSAEEAEAAEEVPTDPTDETAGDEGIDEPVPADQLVEGMATTEEPAAPHE